MSPQAESDEEFIVLSTSNCADSESTPYVLFAQSHLNLKPGVVPLHTSRHPKNVEPFIKPFSFLPSLLRGSFKISGISEARTRKYSETKPRRQATEHTVNKYYSYHITGGFGGSGGEGGDQGGDGGAGHGPTVYFGQPQEREQSEFRTIPLGDINLMKTIRLDPRSDVVGCRSRGVGVRRIYHAEIRRDPGTVTVAMYQGDGAEDEWRQDVAKYESIRHPNVMQLYGLVSTKKLYAMDFHTSSEVHVNLYQWPACPAYWSLDPSGADRLSTEDAKSLGFPTIHIETFMAGHCWDRSVYQGLRRFHEGKGFDPNSQEVARELGYPLYEVLSDRVPFPAHKASGYGQGGQHGNTCATQGLASAFQLTVPHEIEANPTRIALFPAIEGPAARAHARWQWNGMEATVPPVQMWNHQDTAASGSSVKFSLGLDAGGVPMVMRSTVLYTSPPSLCTDAPNVDPPEPEPNASWLTAAASAPLPDLAIAGTIPQEKMIDILDEDALDGLSATISPTSNAMASRSVMMECTTQDIHRPARTRGAEGPSTRPSPSPTRAGWLSPSAHEAKTDWELLRCAALRRTALTSGEKTMYVIEENEDASALDGGTTLIRDVADDLGDLEHDELAW
ncbi:hypothetical protein MSAN_02281300 [Mycena sanguinolenta]|uniref:Protein kinase domain-containing protein n=1 Tax=Mycena sanguinolenta TaxID=230812 RepID=A0A8H7CIK5_9AGAR|nr:hypothetical protein MSAN_02281300 [Mycena sanguinolenta]